MWSVSEACLKCLKSAALDTCWERAIPGQFQPATGEGCVQVLCVSACTAFLAASDSPASSGEACLQSEQSCPHACHGQSLQCLCPVGFPGCRSDACALRDKNKTENHHIAATQVSTCLTFVRISLFHFTRMRPFCA